MSETPLSIGVVIMLAAVPNMSSNLIFLVNCYFCHLQKCELIDQAVQTLMEECSCFRLAMVRLEAGDCFQLILS